MSVRDDIVAEWKYRYLERVAILCGDGTPTQAQKDIAGEEADSWEAERPFGADATSFELSAVTGNADAQVLPMDLAAVIPGGIRIGRGTLDKLQVAVNDDLTGLDQFVVRVIGYRHYP